MAACIARHVHRRQVPGRQALGKSHSARMKGAIMADAIIMTELSPGCIARCSRVVRACWYKGRPPLMRAPRVQRNKQLVLELVGRHHTPRMSQSLFSDGASAIDAAAPTGARPGQGRPRGGVWPTAKLPRAQKNKQPLLELLFCWRNSASAKVVQLLLELLFCWRNSASAKVVQLLLELLFCWRNSASAKVVQLLLELLGVRIS